MSYPYTATKISLGTRTIEQRLNSFIIYTCRLTIDQIPVRHVFCQCHQVWTLSTEPGVIWISLSWAHKQDHEFMYKHSSYRNLQILSEFSFYRTLINQNWILRMILHYNSSSERLVGCNDRILIIGAITKDCRAIPSGKWVIEFTQRKVLSLIKMAEVCIIVMIFFLMSLNSAYLDFCYSLIWKRRWKFLFTF